MAKPLEELGIKPIRVFGPSDTRQPGGMGKRVKSLEELGITPIRTFDAPTQPNPQNNEYSYAARALQFGRGVAEIPAIFTDLGNRYVSAPVNEFAGKAKEFAGSAADYVSPDLGESLRQSAQESYKSAEEDRRSNYTSQVHEKFNEFAGRDITPTDTTGKFLNTTGNFAFPIPGTGAFGGVTAKTIAKEGIKESAKRVGGGLARNTAVGAGGAALLEGTKDSRLSEEGTALRAVEDFVQTLFGMTLADKGLSKAKSLILKKTEDGIINNLKTKGLYEGAKQSLKDTKESLAGRALAKGAKPNQEVNAIAREEGIQLPFQVALGGDVHKFLSNTALKSLFVKRAYKEVIENADRDMINSVISKIDNISPEAISGEIASERAATFLKGEEQAVDAEVKRLYEHSDSLLKPTDTVLPKETIKTVKSMLQKVRALKARVPGPEAKPIADYLLNVGEKFGFLPKKNTLREFKDSPDFLKKIVDSYSSKPNPVPVEDLLSQLQTTYQYTKHQSDIPGLKNLYNGLVSAIQKDINTTTNTEFLAAWKDANKYFKNNEVERLRSNLATSIMKGEIPKEAFKYMGAVPEIKKLKQVLGDSKAGKEIMGSLKRAKLEQVLVSNILDSAGTISYSKLSNMFNTNPEKQALLKELLGDQYKGVKKLATIAQQFVKSGKEFGNPSGTTLAARDIAGLKDMFKVIGNTVLTLAGSVAAHGVTVGASLEPAAIYGFSHLASKKEFVNTAIKYAEAAASKSPKTKEILSKRLSRIVGNFVKLHKEEFKKHPQSAWALHKDNATETIDNQ